MTFLLEFNATNGLEVSWILFVACYDLVRGSLMPMRENRQGYLGAKESGEIPYKACYL